MLRTSISRILHSKALQYRQLSTSSISSDAALRILFCGSDDFSIASLQALHKFAGQDDSNIISIDVLTRTDKLTGRGLSKSKSPLIKSAAQNLGLHVHQINTFTGWKLPRFPDSLVPSYNLIIAVSFGLLIPARVIDSAEFGGLNVHPSLLPDLRGAAPINWAIIRGYSRTGVSVQTLHPTKFDEGVVLSQTGEIPFNEHATINELRDQLSPLGGNLLVQTIRDRLYLKPHKSVAKKGAKAYSLAPKIIASTKLLNPQHDSLHTILLKNRAIPKLYAYALQEKKGVMSPIRLLFSTEMRAAQAGEIPPEILDRAVTGVPFAFAPTTKSTQSDPIYLMAKDGGILVIPRLLVEGRKEAYAYPTAKSSGLFQELVQVNQYFMQQFHANLLKDYGCDNPKTRPESNFVSNTYASQGNTHRL